MKDTAVIPRNRKSSWTKMRQSWQLYVIILPVLLYFLIFKYIPMYGVQIAFKDYIAVEGIFGSPWAGLKHFERFFNSYYFWRLIRNTLGIGLYELAVGTPLPILLALLINEVRVRYFKRFVQTVTYAPHFLSTVVIVGMLFLFLDPTGIINVFLSIFGVEPVSFMTEANWFKTIYVFSGAWQETGWKSIIYMAALAGINPELHEAAKIYGASRLRRIWHIDLPGIRPTIIILLILHTGNVMSVGFEKVFLMQNELNMRASDVIATHVYRAGIQGAEFSYATAVGLFDSVIGLILLVSVNYIARRTTEASLW